MSAFTVVRVSSLSADEIWGRLTAWERHGEFIPLTRVTSSSRGEPGVGDSFVARTGIGPLHFDDPMEVTFWEPPRDGAAGTCRIVKRGTVVLGWAVLTVTPTPVGTEIRWQEDASFRYGGALLAWPNKVVGAHVFGRLVDGLLGPPPAA